MPDKDYSHRDVTDKLGLKPGQAVRVIGKGDRELLARVREKIGRGLIRSGLADVILYWPKTVEEIIPTLAELREQIAPNGGIWVITAKRNQKAPVGWAISIKTCSSQWAKPPGWWITRFAHSRRKRAPCDLSSEGQIGNDEPR